MIAGVVPCAGASTRMGHPKALLDAEGRTFIQSVVDALVEGGCEPVIVVVPEDEEIRSAAAATRARVIANPEPGEGPVTSLRIALGALQPSCRGIVYHPVDHPLVRPETVRLLVAAASKAGAKLAVPTHHGARGHPAFFGRELFGELSDPALEGGARTVVHRHLLDALLLPVDDPGIVDDIDTPAAYAERFGGAL